MEYLSIFLWVLTGILFNKIFTSILNFGILSNAVQKTTLELLLCLVFVEEEIQFLIESRKIMYKEKGYSDIEIENLMKSHDKFYLLWREKLIKTLIDNYPEQFRLKMLPFKDWKGAANLVNAYLKLKKELAKKN